MTDKEQKNNENLNVDECAYYDCENCNSRDYEQNYSIKCARIDCYFKDYARKTQLSIKQSKELIRLRKELQESTVKNRNLKQECEGLKAQLNDMAEYVLTHKYSNEEFQQERKAVADLAFWSNKYKRGLEEIEKELKEDLYCESQECACDDFEECLKCTKEYILDIINEAKGTNE